MPDAGDTEEGLEGCWGIGDLPSVEKSFSSSEPRERCVCADALEASAAAVATCDSSMVPV